LDKRTVIALLIIAVIFIMLPYYWEWTGLSEKPSPEQELQAQADTSTPASGYDSSQPSEPTYESTATDVPAGSGSGIPVLAQLDTIPEQFVEVKTDLFEARISSRGAAISGFTLLKYSYFQGEQIQLIPERDSYPLGFAFPEIPELNSSRLYFTADREQLNLSSGGRDSASITLTATTPGGIPVYVTYTFRRGSYSIGYRVNAARDGDLARATRLTVQWQGGLEPTEVNRGDDYGYFAGYVRQGDEVAKFNDFDDGKMHESSTNGIDWVATKSKYFMVALRTTEGFADEFDVAGTERSSVEKGEEVAKRVFDVALTYRLESGIGLYSEIYIGPVDYNVLSELGHDLDKTVELGWGPLQPFAIAILWLVNGIHKFIPNYGWVLIVFTIIMKIVFFPFQRKNYRQMARMKSLQPKLKALQEKYKEDPQKLNQQMMKFYKEEKFNPLGGCIWMLPQLPIFWALFTVFKASIDLRGASFMWVPDLSQADIPLAIAMAVAMLVQQLLTNKDPKQRFMVYGMPLLMFFLFKGFPAGLVLYWTVYNITGIVEQKSVEAAMARETEPSDSK